MELDEEKIHNLDLAIEDLEKSSAAIKGYSKLFKELAELQRSITKELEFLENTAESLQGLPATIDERIKEYRDTTVKLVVNAGVGVENKLDELVQNTEKQIDASLNRLDKVSTTIDEQTTQVKALFRELDSSLVTRLDKHKSDISLDLRNEGAQIQRALETSLNSTVNKLETVLKTEIEGQ
ncbi:hypothetical protein HUU62_27220 [Rhodoferax sp. 4810]|nr:hypothetical protein [Rhodoferax jenense]